MQYELTWSEGEAHALHIEKVLLKAKNYKVKASVAVRELWNRMLAVLYTEAVPDVIKENCLPQAWSQNFFPMKTTSLRTVSNTHLEVKSGIWLEV